MILDFSDLVFWKCCLKCKCPLQTEAANSRKPCWETAEGRFVAEIDVLKILRVQFSLWCLKGRLRATKGEKPLNEFII